MMILFSSHRLTVIRSLCNLNVPFYQSVFLFFFSPIQNMHCHHHHIHQLFFLLQPLVESCMNTEESELHTEQVKSELEKDSDQLRRNEDLVPRRGATSVAWMWFGYEKSDTDQKTALCKICCRPVPTTNSNTSNLFYHLRKNHVKQYRESSQIRATKVSQTEKGEK